MSEAQKLCDACTLYAIKDDEPTFLQSLLSGGHSGLGFPSSTRFVLSKDCCQRCGQRVDGNGFGQSSRER